jgi:hypothetical protein
MITITPDSKSTMLTITTVDSEGFHRQLAITSDDALQLYSLLHKHLFK